MCVCERAQSTPYLPLFVVHRHDQFGTKYQTQLKVLVDYVKYNGSTANNTVNQHIHAIYRFR